MEPVGSTCQRVGDGGDPHARAAQPDFERPRAPEPFRETRLKGAGAAPKRGEAAGELFGAGAEAGEPAGEAFGGAFELPDPFFQAPPSFDQAVEGVVDAVGDPAQPPDFVARRRDHPGQSSGSPRLRQQRGVVSSGFRQLGREFARAAQGVVLDLRLQGAKAELEGEGADRGLALGVGELLRPLAEPVDRAARPLATGRRPFEPAGQQPGALARAFGAEAQQGAARGALGEAAAQLRDRPSGAAQSRPEPGEAAGAVRPLGRERFPEFPQGLRAAGDGGRAYHRPDPGLGGDPALPAAQQSESFGRRYRPFGGGREEHERRFPAGPDGGVYFFRILPRLVGGGQLVDPGSGGGEANRGGGQEQQRDGDQDRREAGAAQRRGGHRGDPRVGAARAADRPRIDLCAEQRQQPRQGADGDDDAEDRRDPDRHRKRQQQRAGLDVGRQRQGREQRRARRDRGPTRRRPAALRRIVGVEAGGELLAEARDDQERVVDPERQPHHRADDERDRVDRHHRAEQDEDAAAGDHSEGAERERDRRSDDRPEDEQEDDQEQRHREQLGALSRVHRFFLQGPGHRREAGLGRPQWRMDVLFEDPVEFGDRFPHRRRERVVVVDDDQRPARARPEGIDRAAIPGRDHRRVGAAPKRPHQGRALAFDLGGWAGEEDGERRRVAEVVLEQVFALRRPGAGDPQRERDRVRPGR